MMNKPPTPPPGVDIEIALKYVMIARRALNAGLDHYGSFAILNQLRWHEWVEMGNREFKVPNEWGPLLARWSMLHFPDLRGLFKLKKSKWDAVYGARYE
jgi:hypothetical protein